MNNKAQIGEFFEDINPIALAFAFVGAIVSLIVMKNVEVKLIFKILTPIVTFVACYILTSFQFRD